MITKVTCDNLILIPRTERDLQDDLMTACGKGDVQSVRDILENGFLDPNFEHVYGGMGITPLTLAITHGNLEIVNALLDLRADAEAKNGKGLTAIMVAAEGGHLQIVTALLDRGVHVEAKDNTEATALMLAAREGLVEVVTALVVLGRADIKATAAGGVTALMLAALAGHMEVVRALLALGADVEAKAVGWDGMTALRMAVAMDHMEIAAVLQSAKGVFTMSDN